MKMSLLRCVLLCGLGYVCIVQARDLTVSVVIPCAPKHVQHLYNLLACYMRQSVLPEEIIIALSEENNVDKEVLRALKNSPWPFRLIIKATSKKNLAGANRNRGVSAAHGDIIIFQDADDLPHPQRVEIVKYFFAKYEIVHLMHLWIPEKGWITLPNCPTEFMPYVPEKIFVEIITHMGQFFKAPPVTNGNPCIRRKALEEIKWREDLRGGEDEAFNRQVIASFPGKVLIVYAHLLLYRNSLSTFLP